MIDMGFGIVELELGTLLLILSLMAILLDGFFILLGRFIDDWELFSEVSLVAGCGLLVASFLYFCNAMITADYSFIDVKLYVSNDSDLLLRLSAIWSGEAGSYFLWAFFLVTFYVIFRFYLREFAHETIIWRSFVLASFQVAFLIALTLLSDPFQLDEDPVSDGWGLNPLLRNIWNLLHPPPIFLGYAACMVPMAIAMARLSVLENGEIPDFEGKKRLDKFFSLNVSLAWLILSIGIIIGGYWAYVTLGWGGFWAWDPVETASLIPWLFLTIYFHGTPFHRKSKFLANYIISMTYISALMATLITRSELISSVHAFPQEENILRMFLHLEFGDVFENLQDFQSQDNILFLFVIVIATFLLPHIWGIKSRELFRVDLSLQQEDFQASRATVTALKISYLAFLAGTYVITLGLLAPIFYDFIEYNTGVFSSLKEVLIDIGFLASDSALFDPTINVGIDFYNLISFVFGGIVLLAGFFCRFYPSMSFKARLSLLIGGLGAGLLFYAGGSGMLDSLLGEDNLFLELLSSFWTRSDKANLLIPLIFLGVAGTLVTVIRVMIKEEKNFFRKSSQAMLHFSLLIIILGALLSSNKMVTEELLVQEGPEYTIEGTSVKLRIIDFKRTFPESGPYDVQFDTTFSVEYGSNTEVGVTRLANDKVYGLFQAVTIISNIFADIYIVTTGVLENQMTGEFEAAQLQVSVIPYINILWGGCVILILAVLPLTILRGAELRAIIKEKKGEKGEIPEEEAIEDEPTEDIQVVKFKCGECGNIVALTGDESYRDLKNIPDSHPLAKCPACGANKENYTFIADD